MNVSPRLALQVGAIATFLLTVLAGLILVAHGAFEDASHRERERLRLVSSAVGAATEDDVNQVAAVAGLFESSRVVTAGEFRVFARRILAVEPSLNAISFTERVDAPERTAYERRTGRPIVDPPVAAAAVSPTRGVYYPLTYVASQADEPASLGVDAGADPERLRALAAARDSGRPRASAPVTSFADGDALTVVYIPILRAGAAPVSLASRRRLLEGFAVAVFSMRRMEQAVTAALPSDAAFRVVDGDTGRPLIAGGPRADGAQGVIVVGGRRWIVTVAAVDPTLPALAYLLGMAGVLLAALIVAIIVLGARRERHGKDLVTRGLHARRVAERALGTSEERLRSIVETAADAIIVLDREDRIVGWNPAAAALFGREEREAIGRPIDELVPEGHRTAYADAVAGLRDSGRSTPEGPMLELEARNAAGGEFPIELNLSAWGDDEESFVTVIARDVSARVKARVALEASDERHRGILAHVPVGIFETDPGGSYLWVNEHWCQIAGIAADAALGDGWVEAIHPDDRERAAAEYARSLAGAEEFSSEYRFLRPDGAVTWVAVAAVVLRGTEGAVTGRLGTVIDITFRVQAQEALHEAQERLRHAFERSPVGVALVNVDPESAGRFIQVNKALCDITGYGEEALQRMTLQGLSHPDDPTADLELSEWFRRGASSDEVLEKRYLRADGSTVDIELHAAMVRDKLGAPLYAILLLQDVSDRYALERMKDEFLALASHELRTPLTSVMGYVQLVLGEQVGPLNDTQRRLLGVAERNGARLLALVADIHTLARADAGHLAMVDEPFDLSGVARQAVDAMQTVAAERGIALRLEERESAIVLDGDAMRIAQVLDNLLSNAMKFTPSGGEVTLTVGRDGASAEILVEDDGTGIPEREQGEVFERFFRTKAASEQAVPGTGLGLAISRSIVEGHGGTITFRSREGVGTTFSIRLPVGPGVAGPATSVPRAPAGHR